MMSPTQMDSDRQASARRLLADATAAQRGGDIRGALARLVRAYRILRTPAVAGRIADLSLRAGRVAMAERYFIRQGTIPRRLTTEALLGLARCAIARGDATRLAASLGEIGDAVDGADREFGQLLTAAMRARMAHAVAPALAAHIARLGSAPVTPPVARALLQVRDPAAARTLLAALEPHLRGGRPLTGWGVAAYLCAVAGDRGRAVGLLLRLAAAAPTLAAHEPVATAADLLPREDYMTPLNAGGGGSLAAIRDRLRAAVSERTTVLVGDENSIDEILAVIQGAADVDVVPLHSRFNAQDNKAKEWVQAFENVASRRKVRFVDYVADYGDVNKSDARIISDFSDKIAHISICGIIKARYPIISYFTLQNREILELSISDKLFHRLNTRSALISYFHAVRPHSIIGYFPAARFLHETIAIVDGLEWRPRMLVGSAAKGVSAWRRALDADRTVEPNGDRPQDEAESGIQVSGVGEAFSSMDAILDEWSSATALKLAQAPSKPAIFLSTVDPAYRLATLRLKQTMIPEFSPFTLAMSMADGRASDQVPESQLLIDGEQIIDLPFKRPENWSVRVPEAVVATWIGDKSAFLTNQILPKILYNLGELTSELAEGISSSLTTYLPQIYFTSIAIRKLLDRKRPACLVAQPTRNLRFRIASREAQRLGVPVFETMAVYMSRMPRYRRPEASHFLPLIHFCAIFCGTTSISRRRIRHHRVASP